MTLGENCRLSVHAGRRACVLVVRLPRGWAGRSISGRFGSAEDVTGGGVRGETVAASRRVSALARTDTRTGGCDR